ncbi:MULTISPECIES: antibiotic biosynthesis monooxygenase family protein [Actinoalloteichus]|uniref:Antibiotic biosynthesis monooxygenase n=1 Tax=Actinoalloteichus fjordicus TaxID=1612552 RepID=A0AAC9LHJ4_9PSEU|nr:MULTISPECIES: antibiotic biosynthesis monooxygenase [Actinoalloteichus]APU16892.1 Antibiotic biosynthesis monooxygenase [Actinoalloteichus fjordicus]APU22972.1 Antibiotic biosynthesis monooxygenase [Actinoalloteichus sp. GBA129-24]
MLLICRYAVPETGIEDFLAQARTAMRLLGAQPGCRGVQLARTVEHDAEGVDWTLIARFDSVVAYRRALSPFDVREHVVPFLSRAEVGGSAVHEVLVESVSGEESLREQDSLLAEDRDSVRLGEVAGPDVPRR